MIFTNDLERFNIFRVASATPDLELGNPLKNADNILNLLSSESLKSSTFIVLPELCVTGYTCGDLFFQQNLIMETRQALEIISSALKNDNRFIVVGVPLLYNGRLYNCAAAISNGEIVGIVPKINIPNYQEFYEKRWFSSGRDIINQTIFINKNEIPFSTQLLFEFRGVKIGLEVCEDLWVPSPPSTGLATAGADIILNLSATDDTIGKYEYIKSLIISQSSRCRCAYVYSSAGKGESSSDLIFSGINIIACDGKLLSQSERFDKNASIATAFVDVEKLRNDRRKYSTFFESLNNMEKQYFPIKVKDNAKCSNFSLDFHVDPNPFIPSDRTKLNENCREIINIQSWGLERRLEAVRSDKIIIGISGGLDSTLALLVACHTLKKSNKEIKNIIGVTMPAQATSNRTHNNARNLMDILGVRSLEIPVKTAVEQHFKDIGHDPLKFDAVYENSQARERTQILMDLANKFNGIVLGTGDLSELALGWCTYNGDHMSMYNVNAGLPKTLVKHVVEWFASNTEDENLRNVLSDIIDTPISPELVPAETTTDIKQKTEELIGPYELHDFFLYHVLRNGFSPTKIHTLACIAFKNKYSKAIIKKWLVNFYKRFFSQQFKRSCMPDGPKVGSVCLSPRGDWRMPSDASSGLWIDEVSKIKV